MPFNADGTYAGTDAATPPALVAEKAYTGQLRSGHPTPVAAGQVLAVQAMGTTNALAQPSHPAGAVWIEHATAKPMDVLPEAEVAGGIALMAQHKAAIEAYRNAEAAKPKPAPVVPLSAAELAELRAMLAAKATPAAPAHSPVENPAPVG